MEHYKLLNYYYCYYYYYYYYYYYISKLLDIPNFFQICHKKCMEVNDLSSGQYSANKNIRSDLCSYYSDAYIIVKGTIPVEGDDDDKKRNKKLTCKNNAPSRSYKSKINNNNNNIYRQCIRSWSCYADV